MLTVMAVESLGLVLACGPYVVTEFVFSVVLNSGLVFDSKFVVVLSLDVVVFGFMLSVILPLEVVCGLE